MPNESTTKALIEFRFVPKQVIAREVLCCSPNYVLEYRDKQGWQEGIHYVKPKQRTGKVMYNYLLLLDLVQSGGDIHSEDHQRAIAVYLANRLGNQTVRRRSRKAEGVNEDE